MFGLFKLKLVIGLLGGVPKPIPIDMVSRKAADVYTVPGEGELHTRGCTITANRMAAQLDAARGKPFLVFLDAQGEEEGRCELRI